MAKDIVVKMEGALMGTTAWLGSFKELTVKPCTRDVDSFAFFGDGVELFSIDTASNWFALFTGSVWHKLLNTADLFDGRSTLVVKVRTPATSESGCYNHMNLSVELFTRLSKALKKVCMQSSGEYTITIQAKEASSNV